MGACDVYKRPLQADLGVLLTAAGRCLQRNLPSPAAAASLAVGSYVTHTDEAGLPHSTVVAEEEPPEGGAFPPPPAAPDGGRGVGGWVISQAF